MNLRTILEKLGLKSKEIEVFLYALPLGCQPASVIAEKSGLNRVTTYIILKRLVLKGLASEMIKHSMHFFEVAKPKQLQILAKRKEQEWQRVQGHIEEALERLQLPNVHHMNGLKAETFQGKEGVATLLANLTAEKHHFALLSSQDSGMYMEILYKHYLNPILQSHVKELSCYFPKEVLSDHIIKLAYGRNHRLTAMKHSPLAVDILISDQDRIGLILHRDGVLTGVLLHCPSLAQTLRSFLEVSLTSVKQEHYVNR